MPWTKDDWLQLDFVGQRASVTVKITKMALLRESCAGQAASGSILCSHDQPN